MRLTHFFCPLLLGVLAVGCVATSPSDPASHSSKTAPDAKQRAMFFPLPMADDWTKWIVGEWEGAGAGQGGGGHGTARFELALSGQFLVCRGSSVITQLDPDYLKKHMQASDAEIERFRRSGYHILEVYTIDQKTGEVIGFLFDSLRCVATARGSRESDKETMNWEWQTGHKSTRITERLGPNKMRITERTPLPDGSVMEDKGEMTRVRATSSSNLIPNEFCRSKTVEGA